MKYSDEALDLAKKAPDIYKTATKKIVAECYTDGKMLDKAENISNTTTKNIKNVAKQAIDLLDENNKI